MKNETSFNDRLEYLCNERIAEALKGLNSFGYIEKDRVLEPYERRLKQSFVEILNTNEFWLKHIPVDKNKKKRLH